MTSIRTVGVVGAGRMGQPLIRHMVRKGLTVVAHDTDAAKRGAVLEAGGVWAASLADVARVSEAVLICVGYDEELRTLMAPGGLLGSLVRGTMVAVLSTVHPRTMRELAEVARPFGVALVDAPVARGMRGAEAGSLLAFLGGEAADVTRITPVFSCFSTDIVHTGGLGSGQVAKAANNLVLWACVIANHEALALAKRHGVDVELLREALLKGTAENNALRTWGENTMAWADDDMDIVQQMAGEVGIELPQADLNRELCRTLKPKRFRLDEYGV